MSYVYLKALHIIFVVTWFSGIFYLGRLFVYDREAEDSPEPERTILHQQFQLMIKRLLFGITVPSAVLTLILGLALIHKIGMVPVWLWTKIGFLVLLYGYQHSLHKLHKLHKKGVYKYSSTQLRIWNEVPTVLLLSIVMLAVVKSQMSLLYGLVGLAVFTALLLIAIRIYRRLREKS